MTRKGQRKDSIWARARWRAERVWLTWGLLVPEHDEAVLTASGRRGDSVRGRPRGVARGSWAGDSRHDGVVLCAPSVERKLLLDRSLHTATIQLGLTRDTGLGGRVLPAAAAPSATRARSRASRSSRTTDNGGREVDGQELARRRRKVTGVNSGERDTNLSGSSGSKARRELVPHHLAALITRFLDFLKFPSPSSLPNCRYLAISPLRLWWQ